MRRGQLVQFHGHLAGWHGYAAVRRAVQHAHGGHRPVARGAMRSAMAETVRNLQLMGVSRKDCPASTRSCHMQAGSPGYRCACLACIILALNLDTLAGAALLTISRSCTAETELGRATNAPLNRDSCPYASPFVGVESPISLLPDAAAPTAFATRFAPRRQLTCAPPPWPPRASCWPVLMPTHHSPMRHLTARRRDRRTRPPPPPYAPPWQRALVTRAASMWLAA